MENVSGNPVRNVYRKHTFESDKTGQTVIEREVISGEFTEYFTQWMGTATIHMQTPQGIQMLQREFPMVGCNSLADAFERYDFFIQQAGPAVQKRLMEEIAEAQKNAPRIQPASGRAQLRKT